MRKFLINARNDLTEGTYSIYYSVSFYSLAQF